MTLTTTLAISVGPAIAKSILKVWLKDKNLLESIGESITDLVGKKTSDVFTRKKAERQFQEIGDMVALNLVPLFDSDGARLEENERIAVAMAVACTLEKTPITAKFVLDRKLDPIELTKHLLASEPNASIAFSEAETALYERIIAEASRYIVDMASQLPAFTEKTFAELIMKGDQLIETCNKILAEVKKIQEGSEKTNQQQNAARFETDYRLTVGRKLDELELFGADFLSNVNRRHRLSVAYVTLDVCKKVKEAIPASKSESIPSDNTQPDSDQISVDLVLESAKRIIIRGQAGSGKTTLLQWVAVKAASRGFGGALSSWNGCVPFFVRLRDCVETGLPAPEDFPKFVAPSIAGLMPQGWVHNKLASGMALVLVDGIDEMRETQRNSVRIWLKEICQSFPEARIIVSSRPTAIREGWLDAEGFEDAELQPMELHDIYSFIEHWHRAIREELHEQDEQSQLLEFQERLKQVVRNTPAIRSLTTNPLLCAMLCALNRDRRQNLPSDRIELYEACCQMLAERRDKERSVSLDDYPKLSYRQKRPLLEDLAYWFMTNGWSVVERSRAVDRLTKRLANMTGLSQDVTGVEVMRLFVDRTGLLREPQPHHVDFTHRTFQEFFAAKAALDEGDTGALIKSAHEDQWQEMIVLAAGLAPQKVRDELIAGLIERGDKEPLLRHPLHLLAVSCLQTSVELDPSVLKDVESRLRQLVPPENVSEASRLASAGPLAVPYLYSKSSLYAVQAAASIRALAMIGTDSALEALTSYANDSRRTIFNALIIAWQSFDKSEFSKRIFSKKRWMHINRVFDLSGFERCVELEVLTIYNAGYIDDLGPLSTLPKLKKISLHAPWALKDISPLSKLVSLQELDIHGHCQVNDFSRLSDLPNLKTIRLDRIRENTVIPDSVLNKILVLKEKGYSPIALSQPQ